MCHRFVKNRRQRNVHGSVRKGRNKNRVQLFRTEMDASGGGSGNENEYVITFTRLCCIEFTTCAPFAPPSRRWAGCRRRSVAPLGSPAYHNESAPQTRPPETTPLRRSLGRAAGCRRTHRSAHPRTVSEAKGE